MLRLKLLEPFKLDEEEVPKGSLIYLSKIDHVIYAQKLIIPCIDQTVFLTSSQLDYFNNRLFLITEETFFPNKNLEN